ncbi:hypothetical protein [Sphingobacterium sp. LRF_L2]|uniref:hypothetical protein n=1 Tax=Sphingobacterium sp. LRF_L2 TaxID=3369421 RepID=UPI003F609F30
MRSIQMLQNTVCITVLSLFITLPMFVFSQISPPGLGNGKTASWYAVGLQQDLNKEKGWQSMSYFGIGRKSNPDNYNPAYKPAITVFNQEFYYSFRKNWKTSLALSYRRQNEYEEEEPYWRDSLRLQQEFRLYGRISYTFKIGDIRIVSTFRQELRRFYLANFQNTETPWQLRSRFRIQFFKYLDPQNKHKITGSSEQLFATEKMGSSNTWSNFLYKESRLMLYYSYAPGSLPLIFDVGYMNNLMYTDKYSKSVHYLAFDIIIKNPFSTK